MSDETKCELCGEPMPPGESMFKFHGYSGPCPKPPSPRDPKLSPSSDAEWRAYYEDKCRKQRDELKDIWNAAIEAAAAEVDRQYKRYPYTGFAYTADRIRALRRDAAGG